MTDYQQAQLRSFKATMGVSVNHHDAWMNIPGLVKYFGQLGDVIALVDPTADTQQGISSEPVSAVKKKTRNQLAQGTNDIAVLLHAYADDADDVALLIASDYSLSALRRKGDGDLLGIAKQLHTLASTHQAVLVDQGLEADELTNLAASIEKFKGEMGTPRTAIAEGTAQTKARKSHFRTGMAIYRNRLDKLMTRFKTRNPDFYNAYQSARQIINTAKRAAKTPPPPPAA